MKAFPCSWIRRIGTVKMAILPKAIYIFNAITTKIPTPFSKKKKNILKFTQKWKIPWIAILNPKNSARIPVSNFKIDYTAIAIKASDSTGSEQTDM